VDEQAPADQDDQVPPDQDDKPPDIGTPPSGAVEPINTQVTGETTAQQLTEVEKQMSGFEKSTLRWARIAVLMSGLAAAFVCAQWWEMHQGGADTHDLAVSAGKQADRMKDFADRMKDQTDRTKDLADRMKEQADRTKDLADQAKVQAGEAKVAADAAKSAAKTADKALHISERAYIVVGLPAIDTTSKYITLPIVNTGHIPSGKVRGVVHEITMDGVDPTAPQVRVKATETHWKHYELTSVPTTGQIMNFNVLVPALNADNLNGGHEQIVVVGVITYNDGFPDDADRQWLFCEGSAMLPQSKNLQWVICNPGTYLPEAIKEDRYPSNEYPN
jgi:hypothetical protein